MAEQSVLIIGMNGVGAEVAKNLLLSGLTHLTVQDWKKVKERDVGNHPFLRAGDVGKNRASVCERRIAALKLNPNVTVRVLQDKPLYDFKYMNHFNCVVVTEIICLRKLEGINEHCRVQKPSVPFLYTDVRGVFGWCFADMGSEFHIYERPKLKKHPTKLGSNHRQLNAGDIIGTRNVFHFASLKDQLKCVKFAACDKEYPNSSHFGFLGMCTLDAFVATERREMSHITGKFIKNYPKPWCKTDAEKFVNYAREFMKGNAYLFENRNVADIDLHLIQLSFTGSFGNLAPLYSILGGVTSHEVINSICKRHSPLQQWFHIDAVTLVNQQIHSLEYPLNCKHLIPQTYDNDKLAVCIGHPLCKIIRNQRILISSDEERAGVGTELEKICTLLALHDCKFVTTTVPELRLLTHYQENLQQIDTSNQNKQVRKAFRTAVVEVDNYPLILEPEILDQYQRELDAVVNTVRCRTDIMRRIAARDQNPVPFIDSAVSDSIGRVTVSLFPQFDIDYRSYDGDVLKYDRTRVDIYSLGRFPKSLPPDCVDCVEFAIMVVDGAKHRQTTLDGGCTISEILNDFRRSNTVQLNLYAKDCIHLARHDFNYLFTHGPNPIILNENDLLHCQFIHHCALQYATLLRVDGLRGEINKQIHFNRAQGWSADHRLTFITAASSLFAASHNVTGLSEELITQLVVEFDSFFRNQRLTGPECVLSSEPSTFAVVAGLVALEILKTARYKHDADYHPDRIPPLEEMHRNYYANLSSSSKVTCYPVVVEIHAREEGSDRLIQSLYDIEDMILNRFNINPASFYFNGHEILQLNSLSRRDEQHVISRITVTDPTTRVERYILDTLEPYIWLTVSFYADTETNSDVRRDIDSLKIKYYK